jgi:hypothetical protein
MLVLGDKVRHAVKCTRAKVHQHEKKKTRNLGTDIGYRFT